MASLLNSTIDSNLQSYTGNWENISTFSSVRILMKSTKNGVLTMQWSNNNSGDTPLSVNPTLLSSKTMNYISTDPKEFIRDHEGAWFRILYTSQPDPLYTISTMHQNDSAVFKITDDSQNAVEIVSNSARVVLGSGHGKEISSTNTDNNVSNTALFINLTDASGKLLKTVTSNETTTTIKSVGISFREVGSFTNVSNKSGINVHPTDISGHSQASSDLLESASGNPGVAMFLALPSSSRNCDVSNSIFTHLRDLSGLDIGSRINPLPVYVQKEDLTYATAFDVKNSSNQIFAVSGAVYLHSLHAYNTTHSQPASWIDVHDTTTDISLSNKKLSIPVHVDNYRDLVFPLPVKFASGIALNFVNGPNQTGHPEANSIFTFGLHTPVV